MSDWKEFGRESWKYLYAAAWVKQKQFNQTHNTGQGIEGTFAPLNYLWLSTTTATPDHQLFVTPNLNVLYGSAHINLADENVLLHPQKNYQDGYCIWQFMDAFTNVFAYIGSTSTAESVLPVGEDCKYALVHSSRAGTAPSGYQEIVCDTADVWLVVRYFTRPDVEGYSQKVAAQMAQSPLGPESDFPAFNRSWNVEAFDRVDEVDFTSNVDTTARGIEVYQVMSNWLAANGWGPSTEAFQELMTRYGLSPDLSTDWIPPFVENPDILEGIAEARELIQTAIVTATTESETGWRYSISDEMGNYDTNYLLRSVIALVGLGANKLSQCVYPACRNLKDRPYGGEFNANFQYTIDVPSDWLNQTSGCFHSPGFWSITVYNSSGENAGRIPVTEYDALPTVYFSNFNTPSDSDLKIFLSKSQSEVPSGYTWLPLSISEKKDDQRFYLIMRCYGPWNYMYQNLASPWWAPEVEIVESSQEGCQEEYEEQEDRELVATEESLD